LIQNIFASVGTARKQSPVQTVFKVISASAFFSNATLKRNQAFAAIESVRRVKHFKTRSANSSFRSGYVLVGHSLLTFQESIELAAVVHYFSVIQKLSHFLVVAASRKPFRARPSCHIEQGLTHLEVIVQARAAVLVKPQ
jgi:hypothetical protein